MKDFSILMEKVSVTGVQKDISLVTDFNAYAQYIEVVCKTQKGELVSNNNIGSDYYTYIFDGQANLPVLETTIAGYIQAAIPRITNVSVRTQYSSPTQFQFLVYYSIFDGTSKQENNTTFVEVEL
jgi:hypothetical protein